MALQTPLTLKANKHSLGRLGHIVLSYNSFDLQTGLEEGMRNYTLPKLNAFGLVLEST